MAGFVLADFTAQNMYIREPRILYPSYRRGLLPALGGSKIEGQVQGIVRHGSHSETANLTPESVGITV